MKLLELFGGIGACSKAFKRLKIPIEIADYVEIDKYAVASYNAINGTDFETQDITKWNKDLEVDFIMHGSPCQDFSVAGKNAGGDEGSGTRSSLMYETIRIVNKLKPKYVIWENVKNLLSKKHKHNFDKYVITMNKLGYNSYYQVLNAKDYGIPQNRERVFTISIRQDIDKGYAFPEKQELKLKLKDMLENNVDEKYYLSDKMIIYMTGINQNNSNYPRGERFLSNINRKNQDIANSVTTNAGNRPTDNFVINKKQQLCDKLVADFRYDEGLRVRKELICPTITRDAGKSSPSGQPLWIKNNTKLSDLRIRKLTPKECWRLMGFDDEDFDKAKLVNSDSQLYKQAGNSIVVNVLERILENLFIKDENEFEGQMNFEMLGGSK